MFNKTELYKNKSWWTKNYETYEYILGTGVTAVCKFIL